MRSVFENKDITICCRFESWCIDFNHSLTALHIPKFLAVTPNAEYAERELQGDTDACSLLGQTYSLL